MSGGDYHWQQQQQQQSQGSSDAAAGSSGTLAPDVARSYPGQRVVRPGAAQQQHQQPPSMLPSQLTAMSTAPGLGGGNEFIPFYPAGLPRPISAAGPSSTPTAASTSGAFIPFDAAAPLLPTPTTEGRGIAAATPGAANRGTDVQMSSAAAATGVGRTGHPPTGIGPQEGSAAEDGVAQESFSGANVLSAGPFDQQQQFQQQGSYRQPVASSSSASMVPVNPPFGQAAPAPPASSFPLMPSDGEPRTFELIIRQSPVQGRMCGFGSKDRRPLDPVPIVQLKVHGPDGRRDEDAESSPHLLMQVGLQLEHPEQEATLVKNSSDYHYPWRRALEGKLVSSGHVVRDLNGERGCFFVFPDLSVRLEGSYRLRFSLIRLGPHTPGPSGGLVATADSNPFRVYAPREFPGMLESTELAKALARAGVLISTRSKGREQ